MRWRKANGGAERRPTPSRFPVFFVKIAERNETKRVEKCVRAKTCKTVWIRMKTKDRGSIASLNFDQRDFRGAALGTGWYSWHNFGGNL